jgi:serine/threonine protein phosphatase PrpC
MKIMGKVMNHLYNKKDFLNKSPIVKNKNISNFKKGFGGQPKRTTNFDKKEIGGGKNLQILKKTSDKISTKNKAVKTSSTTIDKKMNKEKKESKNNIEEKLNKEQEENNLKILSEISSNFISEIFKEIEENNNNEEMEPKKVSKQIVKIGNICKNGFSGPEEKKVNQDNFFIYKNFISSPDIMYLGVCDGHGLFGHTISDYIVKNLPESLNSSFIKENITSLDDNFEKISSIISLTFVQTNINLVNDSKIDTTYSGTTCSSLLFSPNKLISINLGDSRCVLGKYDGNKWIAKSLTRDHKPNEEDEKKRIISKGGKIEPSKDEEGKFVGPERVWLKEQNLPGIAMSRSFGDDIAHSVGVISQPEIFEYNFENEDKFIILASDGIWEFISNEECVNVIKDYYLKDNIDDALNYLYKESSKRWMKEEELIDDITLIIIFLKD